VSVGLKTLTLPVALPLCLAAGVPLESACGSVLGDTVTETA